MMDPAPQFTPQQWERLAILAEELGEAQQALGKMMRHGPQSQNPFKPEDGNNMLQLERELGHVVAAFIMLADVFETADVNHLEPHIKLKLLKVKQWLHYPVQ